MKRFLSIVGVGMAALAFMPTTAQADECSSGFCGTPDQSGGGCGCGCGSILVAMTDRGDTYQFADDQDGDGVEDDFDNCPFRANYDQLDQDGDLVGDACDLCPATPDSVQSDIDGDGVGDACDDDIDGDDIPNALDNCPNIPNFAQTDTDGDQRGDVCDDDDDGDGILDVDDACRLLAGTTVSSECEDDPDGDQIDSKDDNCPGVYNPVTGANGQPDADGDGVGDACDIDIDGDGFYNFEDNCAAVFNPSQIDVDMDGLGDAGNWNGVGETCDPSECYVVSGDRANCLSPSGAFDIALLIPARQDRLELVTGNLVGIKMFTNRIDELHNWTARFEQIPDSSSVSLFNARGSATTIERNLVASLDGAGIQFTPDEPGRYVIKVTANLPNGDEIGPTTATATIIADVGGESQSGGCAAGGGSGLAALALAMFASALRRRRG